VLCHVAALRGYLGGRPPIPEFLFRFNDDTLLSHIHVCSELKLGLQAAGIDSSGYSGHSFRIGAASTAAQVGFSDSLI